MPFLIFAMIANAINQGSVFPYFAKVSKSIDRRRYLYLFSAVLLNMPIILYVKMSKLGYF